MTRRELRIMMIGIFVMGLFAGVVLACTVYISAAQAEDCRPVYVTASVLNGRAEPTKKAPVEAFFDQGDPLEPTGRISRDRKWLEVEAGERGTVWVYMEYVTERVAPFVATNENNGKVKIRSLPGEGKVKGYVKRGQSIVIDQVIFNWGHCRQGWVDLDYLIEEEEMGE